MSFLDGIVFTAIFVLFARVDFAVGRCVLVDFQKEGSATLSVKCLSSSADVTFLVDLKPVDTSGCSVSRVLNGDIHDEVLYEATLACPVRQTGSYLCKCADGNLSNTDQESREQGLDDKYSRQQLSSEYKNSKNPKDVVEAKPEDMSTVLIVVGSIFAALLIMVPVGWFLLRRRYRRVAYIDVKLKSPTASPSTKSSDAHAQLEL